VSWYLVLLCLCFIFSRPSFTRPASLLRGEKGVPGRSRRPAWRPPSGPASSPGDAIVAAGRKAVFSLVAEARAAAARASRIRAGRVRGDRLPSLDGSTASGSIADIARVSTTALVSNFCWYRYQCTDISILI
jgi:hypothetical protein